MKMKGKNTMDGKDGLNLKLYMVFKDEKGRFMVGLLKAPGIVFVSGGASHFTIYKDIERKKDVRHPENFIPIKKYIDDVCGVYGSITRENWIRNIKNRTRAKQIWVHKNSIWR
jgi:hypothetical protein